MAFNRLGEVHYTHVPLCRALLREFHDPQYKYRHQITRQYMLASGAFLIEKAVDVAAMNVASVGSVLKVYSAILQQEPDAKFQTPRRPAKEAKPGQAGRGPRQGAQMVRAIGATGWPQERSV
jgi:hypothetical protein